MSNPIITKKYHFCASHKYGNDHWSEEKNWEVFNKDYNIHGHNYILEVTMTGPVNPNTGWLVDLGQVNKIVKSNVINIIDHSQIERDIPWFEGKQPSSEVIVVWIWEQIAKDLKGAQLHRIRLVETHSIHTDYYGPQ
jgi:6-pyruvoyltetrahydropterin/6-carboxytetrahydropterin synthase